MDNRVLETHWNWTNYVIPQMQAAAKDAEKLLDVAETIQKNAKDKLKKDQKRVSRKKKKLNPADNA